MKLKMMYSFLNSDLTVIENELEETIKAESPLLHQASLHLLQAGGKRIRPVFVLLAAKFGEYDIDKIKNVAVSLELIHMASLVHDDVIDDAELRRGQPTIKAKWDNKIAMYTGDYIFARALELITNIQNPHAHKILSHTLVELCIGEIEQIKDKYNYDQNIRTYFRRIKRKTAMLIAVSCQLGGIAANVEEDIHKKLFKFGYFVGMSYQIIDDVLDFVGTEKELGKPAGGDLHQGNITLPALFAMEDSIICDQISRVHEGTERSDIEKIIALVKDSGAIEKSLQISDKYLQKALGVLEELPPSRSKKALRDIAKFIGKRKF
ncbi:MULTISPECIES: heptaprenyl diphosphate synthase component II [Cytobacillus]|jgi:heptaprenyl diphosphate synthase|uniref:Heptaprenyl diphosphate synthase component 2 n=1 Tax=Cytobacillus oceanisediminis 2691 TaxID=1196031 RepID=A0A161JUL8_9BACI|nr:heptaprenyl diphosphate synthase component II [Cytobacillus oceanisediminis]MBY0154705.1 heptaprenyl diphosphate synthase component II [Cytobacillus firmus]AND41241.1 heptaprenyl diphosphate synthase [Cytobacillus oceanisediminis 2691]MBU8733572.1 heptaprenyl diphosphate synthase component II [Cytobacillus oceanisediminis]MCM3243599.1 heptaprenyl diphosphate synthase component II [Cytobacillus oceanisediminis]MCM3393924.1 heptaprenyl diphosphate synthase component II [Cytobacillus oceanised